MVRQAFYQESHIPVSQQVVEYGGAPTIDDVFTKLEDALDDLPTEWMVAYNDEFGIPSYASIASNEMTLLCDDWVPLGELQNELKDNKGLWSSYGIVSYSFTFRRDCTGALCSKGSGVEMAKTHIVGVVEEQVRTIDGKLLNETFIDGNVSLGRGSYSDYNIVTSIDFPIIPNLFDQIDEGLKNNAYRVDTLYDEEFGYPRRVWMDEIAGTSLDASFGAHVKLLSIEKQTKIIEEDCASRKGVDLAMLDPFATAVVFVLLTVIFLH